MQNVLELQYTQATDVEANDIETPYSIVSLFIC